MRRYLTIGVLAAALALPAADASAAVINFENLDAPSPNSSGLLVNDDYDQLGVLFPDLRAFDYNKQPGAIPGFAHSGGVALENCFAVEFCLDPLRASFTTEQDLVRVWVGFISTISQNTRVRMTAYNGTGGVVGTDQQTIAPPNSPPRIATALTVDPPNPVITRIEVAVIDGGGFTNGLAMDDLEFSTVGPPPPCTPPAPSVEVKQPPGGLVVHNDMFPIEGSVKIGNPGSPITRATVVSTGAGGTRTGAAYPGLIDADGGDFGPTYYGGLLQPGDQAITVTATNCFGTGTSAPVYINHSPLPPSTFVRQLGQIEVNQSIQNPDNGVPLVGAGTYGVKRTFARVYLRAEGGTSQIHGLSGRLGAVRPDGSRPPGPQTISALNSIRADAWATRESVRATLATSLNFELPPEWLGVGKLHLQLEQLTFNGFTSSLTCKGCENIDDNGPGPVGPAMVEFRTPPPMRLTIVDAPWDPPGPVTAVAPRPVDVDSLSSWLRRAYPTGDIQIRRGTLPTFDHRPDCNEVNAALLEWAGGVWRRPARFYAMYSDNGGDVVGGCIIKNASGDDAFGSGFGSGPAGAPQPPDFAAWDTDASYADAYGGHEIAHQYFRLHPGFANDAFGRCTDGEQNEGDTAYPYANGLIGNSLYDNQALDAGDAALPIQIPLTLGDWRSDWHDVMSYCDNQWPSAYTYTAIMKYMCGGDGISYCLNVPQVKRPAGTGAPPAPAARKGGPRLLVTGTLRGGRVDLDPLSVLPRISLTERPRKSRYAVVLRGSGGKVAARYPFAPGVASERRRPGEAFIHAVVPYEGGTERIEITRGKRVLETVRVSAHAPSAQLTAPRKKRVGNAVKVTWRGRDADGDRLSYTLHYAADGKHFTPVAAGLRHRSYKVDLTQLGGGPKARFRLIATDGVRTAIDTSRRFKAPVEPPRVLISTPAPGAELSAGEPVALAATASDLQDGSLPGKRVVWRSSLDGALGTGAAISARLGPGTHEITATATNKAGATGAATVSVIVVAQPPVLQATLVP